MLSLLIYNHRTHGSNIGYFIRRYPWLPEVSNSNAKILSLKRTLYKHEVTTVVIGDVLVLGVETHCGL